MCWVPGKGTAFPGALSDEIPSGALLEKAGLLARRVLPQAALYRKGTAFVGIPKEDQKQKAVTAT